MAVAAPSVVRAQAKPVIRVGLGPQQPTQADTKRVWEPIYERSVRDKIGAQLQLQVANDWAGIATALANEQIDIAQMGPWGYVLARIERRRAHHQYDAGQRQADLQGDHRRAARD